MKQDTAGAGRKTTGLLRGSLVGVQVAICMVLMIAAGLLLRGLYAAQTVDPGFEYRRVASVTYDLRGANYSAERAVQFQSRLLDEVRSIPGVEMVAQTDTTPLDFGSNAGMFAPAGRAQLERVENNVISPEFFSVIGTPVVLGRNFDVSQDRGAHAVIVTESTARHFWPGKNPLGQSLEWGGGRAPRVPLRVIGVVRDAQLSQVGTEDTLFLYFLAGPENQGRLSLLVRSGLTPLATANAIRARVRRLDPNLVVNVAPLEANLDLWRGLARLVTGLSASLGGLALILASIGVYSVVSYAVSRRLREVGIRMVLGASAVGIRSLLLKQTLRPVWIGSVIGGVAAAGVARILESVLFGVSAHDPIAFLGAPAVLMGVTVMATLIPMRRAMNVDPMTVLRYD